MADQPIEGIDISSNRVPLIGLLYRLLKCRLYLHVPLWVGMVLREGKC
jgi:hypothetical protein